MDQQIMRQKYLYGTSVIKIVFNRHHASKISNMLLNKTYVILLLVCSLTLLSTSAYSENDAQSYFKQAIEYADANANSIKYADITACDDDDCAIAIYPTCTNSKEVPGTFIDGAWVNGILSINVHHHESVDDPCVRSGTIIITDVFDPDNSRDVSEIHRQMKVSGEKHIVDIMTDVRSNTDCTERDPDNSRSIPVFDCRPGPLCGGDAYWCGYDVIIVDFIDGAGDIKYNSMVLQNIIRDVNRFDDKEIILIGPSMGGIISKHALWQLELNSPNTPHNVRLFISLDAPHNGAYMPLGVQYMSKFFIHHDEKALELYKILDTKAAKQMLVHHVDSNRNTMLESAYTEEQLRDGNDRSIKLSIIPYKHPDNLLDEIMYPTQSRNIAISNGNGIGMVENIERRFIDYEYVINGDCVDILGIITTDSCDTYVEYIVSFEPESSKERIFYAKIDPPDTQLELLSPLEGILSLLGIYEQTIITINQRYDIALVNSDATASYWGMPCGTHNAYESIPGYREDIPSQICFVPTISALDLPKNIDYDIDSDLNILDFTPFDAIYYPNENQEHLEITKENMNWILCEIFDSERWSDFECGIMPESNTRDSFREPAICSDINDCFNKMIAVCDSIPSVCAEPNFKIIIDDIAPILERLPNTDHSITANVEHELESYINNNIVDYQLIDHNNFDHNE